MTDEGTKNSNSYAHDSLLELADSLVVDTQKLVHAAKTEEDLRIGFEKLLDPIKNKLGIRSEPKYEKSVFKGRSDAVHGQVIIEYEPPGSFSSKQNIDHAYNQLIDYMCGESKDSSLAGLVGVGFDGEQIFFVQYQDRENKSIDKSKFFLRGPYDFVSESSRTFLIHFRALSRLPLTAENLAQKFGPGSALAPKAVSAFADALEHWGDQTHIRTFLNEWKRLFGIVYGEQFNFQQAERSGILAALYGITKETDFQELLFCVHTYFAFLMKLIAADLVTMNEGAFTGSFSYNLTHASKSELPNQLADVEDGGVFAKRGVTNFLEGDFFRWYLYCFSPRLEDAIREIARELSEFEPATTKIAPEPARDLLKKLYQYLVPQEVRHDLGEYYTPDWLAEFVLDEVGYNGNTLKRLLDPACGSGTFLVLALQRAREYGAAHREPPLETAKRIIANVWGFDLNPLAIIASRTNYLFALGDLANELQGFEIPIYLADSVLWPERKGQLSLGPEGESVEIATSIKTFFVPRIWVINKGFLMRSASLLIEEMVKNQYNVTDAMAQLKRKGLVFPPHESVVGNFYEQIVELEKAGKNGIWARFLKNIFAPMNSGEFDFVVGNPPWIRWGYLSQEYREATLPLWQNYGLFSLKGHAARLGGGEKDFSMLFTYTVSDYYLKDGGRLGFLITQEVFKSKGAGEGFRHFKLGDNGKSLKVLKAHDLATVQPFEGAANKTAAIVLQKCSETKYPVPYTVWQRKKGIGKIPTNFKLNEALPFLQKQKLLARPMGSKYGSWQTLAKDKKSLVSLKGENNYQARLGARADPYGVFWLELRQVLSNGDLLVRNMPEMGKWKIQNVEERIESDLVYPAVRGSDIARWGASPVILVLITQDPKKRKGHPESKMKSDWPRTFGYLVRFKSELLKRAVYKKFHSDSKNPFYSQYSIADYTFARYKVIWKRMANDIVAAVISQFKTPFGYKKIIPTDTTALFPTDNENEAHYLCAVINSTPVREFIKSFSSAGRGFGTPSVMEHVGIPKFDHKNKMHQNLTGISKRCHDLKLAGKEKEIEKLEKENNELVKQLFKLTEIK